MGWKILLSHVLLSALIWIAYAKAPPSRGNSVLVVGESVRVEETHSQIIKELHQIGRKVTFKTASSKKIDLESEGEYLYDAVVLLAPQAGLQTQIPVSRLIAFVDSGRDVFIASSARYSTFIEKVTEMMGVDLDDKQNMMVDHQHTVTGLDNDNHTFIQAGGWTRMPFAMDDDATDASSVVFRGAGATLFKDNELVHPLLWGAGSSYGRPIGRKTTPLSKVPRVAGTGAALAAAVCTRDGARVTWFGSFDALSDDVMRTAGERHAVAMKRLVQWSVGEIGVLRVVRVAHGRMADGGAGEEGGPSDYRVKDVIEFMIQVQMWNGTKQQWVGFETDDMQVEFVMMNPWVRTRLHLVDGSDGVYKAKIQVPDQIGVYKFKVEYVRRGLSSIFMEKVIPVRPFLHNEYERFIQMASPYYVSAFSMLVGVFLLGLVLLYGGGDDWTGANGTREKSE